MTNNVTAVIYEPLPDDPDSGRILWVTQAPAGAMLLEPRPWIPADDADPEIDQTHKVKARQLVQTHRWILDGDGRRVGVEPL